MRKYLIAAAAFLAFAAPAAMAQSRDGYRGGQDHGAQRGYGNSGGYGYNGAYDYDGNYRQTYRNERRQAYRHNNQEYRDDRGYRNEWRHERQERREHRRDDRY